jgi:hypothetical protein
MGQFRPYFRMVGLAPFWLPASSLVTDKPFLLGASSRFHPSSGGRTSGSGANVFRAAHSG